MGWGDKDRSMNDIMMRQYNMLSKELQQEVQHYIEYLFVKMKKTNRQHIVTIPQQEKNRAYDALIQYAGCLPPDIDYKQEAIEFAVTKYESLT